jgi:hypothetical protein
MVSKLTKWKLTKQSEKLKTDAVKMKHAEVLAFYKPLPKALREKIQEYHKSTAPKFVCAECHDALYKFQVSTRICMWDYGSICKLCEKWGFTEGLDGYSADSE